MSHWTRVFPPEADWNRFAEREISGAVAASFATTSGVVAGPASVSGSVQAGSAVVAGQIDAGIRVSGAVQAQAATTAGVIEPTFAVQGAVQAQAAVADGSVRNASAVQGGVQAQAATVCSAVCVQLRAVAGAVQSQAATVSGSVTTGNVVLDDAAGSVPENSLETTKTVSVTIGSGTGRKIFAPVSIEDPDNGFTGHSVTFDPGGADETTGVQIAGAAITHFSLTDLHADAFFIDIDDGVSAGTYTVELENGEFVRRLALGAFALSNTVTGQPETVENAEGGGSVIDTTITTVADGAIVCDHIALSNDNGPIRPDDGQTEQYEEESTGGLVAGSSLSVSNAATVNTGWSWDGGGAAWLQVAVSVAPPSTLLNGLVSWHSLEEASGTRVDSEGDNDLTDNNTVTQVSGGGPDGQDVAQFTAANDESLSITDAAQTGLQPGNTNWTESIWVWFDDLSSGRKIATKWDNDTQNEFDLFFAAATGGIRVHVSADGSTTVAASPEAGSPTTGTWVHVIWWQDADNDEVGISIDNGTPVTDTLSGGVFTGTASFRLGGRDDLAAFLDGRLWGHGVWNRVLTAQERTDLFNGGSGLAHPFS